MDGGRTGMLGRLEHTGDNKWGDAEGEEQTLGKRDGNKGGERSRRDFGRRT